MISRIIRAEWHSFVSRFLELLTKLMRWPGADGQFNEIRLSIDKDGDGQATDLATQSDDYFLEYGTGSTEDYNAVKMKTQLDDLLAGFESYGYHDLSRVGRSFWFRLFICYANRSSR